MLTYENLRELAKIHNECLSVFEPLVDKNPANEGSDAGLAAAAKKADRLMAEAGISEQNRAEMLRPLQKIADNLPWRGRSGSLVMFHSPGFTRTEYWPFPLKAEIFFAKGEFFVLPLLPGMLSEQRFWLLALDVNRVRLFSGSMERLDELALPHGVPSNLDEFLALKKPDHTLRGHSAAGPSMGYMKSVQFGVGSPHEKRGAHLHDFFRAIDQNLLSLLTHDRRPLIIAAVERELALYRSINSYPMLCSEGIHGNPGSLGTEKLHERALAILASLTRETNAHESDLMERAAGQRLLATRAVDVIDAASIGQVERLIISREALTNGACAETINWAALAVLRTSGSLGITDAPLGVDCFAAILRPAARKTRPQESMAGAGI